MVARQKAVGNSLKINGLTWAVIPRRRIVFERKCVDGLCSPVVQQLLYLETLHHERQRKTILHEALHAILKDTPYYRDEALIETLEAGLDPMLADNEWFRDMY